AAGAALRFWSVELHPLRADDMARALRPWPALAADAAALIGAWRAAGEGRDGDVRATLPGLSLTVAVGEARRAAEAPMADQWLLDGFAPARNPSMWRAEVLTAVGAATRPGGAATTYAAASAVRQGLETVGFEVERRPGFGRKRHMTLARRR
ncbi:MAG: tRNA (5-methylaminomethyl-2-thiouridine)(34)-methyltransferase MnmD, partial [Pseudomonadota bacterium]